MLNDLFVRYPKLETSRKDIEYAARLLAACYQDGNKLLLCGNGGSYADCLHIAGELMKGFREKRSLPAEKRAEMAQRAPGIPAQYLQKLQMALPAIALGEEGALTTAVCNDIEPELCFAQQVLGYGAAGDVLLCISTSGNAKNVIAAAQVAKGLGLSVLGLSGADFGVLHAVCDVCICVPERETYRVQELHLPVYHALCMYVEQTLFPSASEPRR